MKRFMTIAILVTGALACGEGAPPVEGPLDHRAIPHPFSVPAEDGVAIGGMQLGEGKRPLIVIHGGPGMDHRYLRPSLDRFSDSHWVIYMDQRGTGLSAVRPTPDLINFNAMVEDIDRIRRWTGAEQIDLLGHSWGTQLAMYYAMWHEEAVHRMVLVSPVEPGTRYRSQAMSRRNERVDPADQASLAEITASDEFGSGDAATISRYYEIVFKPMLYDPTFPLRIPLDTRTAKNGFEVMNALAGSMPSSEFWAELPSIFVPTLLVQGASDAYPVDMVMEMAAELGDGRAMILEEAGHFPYIEAPSAFFDGVRAFLDPSGGL